MAIAVIAPITILLSRAVRPDGLHNLVAAIVHWGLFEQPGLDIGAIDVPVAEFHGGTLPTREDINNLIQRVRDNIEDLRNELTEEAFDQLNAELDRAKSIAPDKLEITLQNQQKINEEPLSLTGDGYGTHFILLPTAPELDDDIDGGTDKDASALEKNLLGFSNTMTGDKPVIRTEFRDHHLDETPEELIGPRNFFLPEEYEKADHHFKGTFDVHGQFTGTVNVYGERKPFVCNWVEGRGRSINCGPFSIDVAYLMGEHKESHLSADDHKTLYDKLFRIGGLYIYRDGIRILPYGNSDLDFLDMEKRRTKSAQDWFFSYRRVFGYIAINKKENSALNEKAGREGFRQNQAYRDFRVVLINFFQRLALEFFRPSSPQGETYWDQKNAFTAEAKFLEKQKKKADERRTGFGKLLQRFFERYNSGELERRAEEIGEDTENRLQHLMTLEDDGDLAIGVRELETDVWKRISALGSDVIITKPRGLSLTSKLEKDWASYQRMSGQVRTDVIEPLRRELIGKIRHATENRISEAQRRAVALQLLESQRDGLVRDLSVLRNDAYAAAEETLKTIKDVVREEFAQFREAVETLLINFTRKTATQPLNLEESRAVIEREITVIRERQASLLDSIRRQMTDFAESIKERETLEDRTGAMEQRTQRLEEQVEFYSDFAQMGMSVGILQHEFEKTARDMRTAMRDLKPWADGTPKLKVIYRRLRDSFDHIDGYLKLLDPLGRRLNRSKVEISGDEIRMHLLRIFRKALDENGIKVEASSEFLAYKVKCRSSALLGAFINIVDNAIYWVANGAKREKVIRLNVDNEGFLVSNSGPGIEERLRERIFEFGETTKPGGRGMGLAISRDTLRREGFDIELMQAGSDIEPVFRINTAITDEEGAEGDK
ncbi:MAG: ATP-binding protein [Syntrophales bacterium]|nr:ATP-binding protein [Syntrophales bacterium]